MKVFTVEQFPLLETEERHFISYGRFPDEMVGAD
jgi:hypothetical protein